MAMNKQVEKVVHLFERLAGRWEDESEYEDFNEYVAAFTKGLPPEATFVSMTKRPFRATFRIVQAGCRYRYELHATRSAITMNQYSEGLAK